MVGVKSPIIMCTQDSLHSSHTISVICDLEPVEVFERLGGVKDNDVHTTILMDKFEELSS